MHFNFKRAQYSLQHYKIFKYHGNHENCNKILGYRIKAEQTSLSLRWSTSKFVIITHSTYHTQISLPDTQELPSLYHFSTSPLMSQQDIQSYNMM